MPRLQSDRALLGVPVNGSHAVEDLTSGLPCFLAQNLAIILEHCWQLD